jgi:phosphorylcholine metabolism protein LicD
MKVSWDDEISIYIYMEKYKENVPNHQPVMNVDDILRIYVEY